MSETNESVKISSVPNDFWKREITRKVWWRRGAIVLFIILLFLAECNRKARVDSNDKDVVISELIDSIGDLHKRINFLENNLVEVEDELAEKNSKEPTLVITRTTTKSGRPATQAEIIIVDTMFDAQTKAIIPDRTYGKPALMVTTITKTSEEKQIINIDAVIVPKSSDYKSHMSFEIDLKDDSISREECDAYIEYLKDSLDDLKNDSIEIVMDKKSPDGNFFLGSRKMSYADILSMEVNPVIGISHTFTEYWDNPYRRKAEKSFRNGVIFGVAGAGLYGVTEWIGHPIFRDSPADNSDAQQKSNTIKGLRIGAAVLGTVSLVEFTRAWHFHRLEGKYIVSPTTVGVSVNLSSLSK
jgi:hypothetical protein